MKKLLSAASIALGRVDLAGAQAFEQRLGREVDEHDLVGAPEDRVGDGLAHADAAQLGDVVVERLEVLDVERGDDVDAGRQYLLDVLVALGVLEPGALVWASSSIRHSSGARRRIGGEVHLLQHGLPIAHPPARQHRQSLGGLGGFSATVRLEQADHDVAAHLLLDMTLVQHAVGLADAGGHPEEDLQATPALIGRCGLGERSFRRAGLLAQPPSRLWTIRSISLMPMNGAMSPPRP